MEIKKRGCFRDWKATRTCSICKAELIVRLEDLFWDRWVDGNNRRSGPRFECPECETHNDIAGAEPDVDSWTLGDLIAPNKSAWKTNMGSIRVPAPGEHLNMQHRKSPALRLLAGCITMMEVNYLKAGDTVVVDVAIDGSPARPEFAGCFDNDVIAQVVQRLEELHWIVDPIREEPTKPPHRLVLTADMTRLRLDGWRV